MLQRIINGSTNKEIDEHILTLFNTNGKDFIRIDTIVRCEMLEAECVIYLNNGNKHAVNKTLKGIIRYLPAHKFLKVHHLHIVNIDFINRYIKSSEDYLVMHDGTNIPISRTLKKVIKELMKAEQIF
jgi:two-component system, LytTR family, response regulator